MQQQIQLQELDLYDKDAGSRKETKAEKGIIFFNSSILFGAGWRGDNNKELWKVLEPK
jgi:hypothetical protein